MTNTNPSEESGVTMANGKRSEEYKDLSDNM